MRLIQGWNHRDVAICVQDITQNMLVQNALAPGAASIIATLMEAKNVQMPKKSDDMLKFFLQG